MGKYSDLPRNERDWYATPMKATLPLIHFLRGQYFTFIEPFCGDGKLIQNLESGQGLTCCYASDIEPQFENLFFKRFPMKKHDYRIDYTNIVNDNTVFISNPPWLNTPKSGYQLNEIVLYLIQYAPVWFLLDGNMMFNLRAQVLMKHCSDVIPVGRVKWIEDSKYTSKENVAWYRFQSKPTLTIFHERIKL